MKTLVTKLMSSVNNTNIPYFNAIEIVRKELAKHKTL